MKRKTPFEKIKDGFKALGYLIIVAFTLGGLWSHVAAYENRIALLESWQGIMSPDMAVVKNSIVNTDKRLERIERKIDELK